MQLANLSYFEFNQPRFNGKIWVGVSLKEITDLAKEIKRSCLVDEICVTILKEICVVILLITIYYINTNAIYCNLFNKCWSIRFES